MASLGPRLARPPSKVDSSIACKYSVQPRPGRPASVDHRLSYTKSTAPPIPLSRCQWHSRTEMRRLPWYALGAAALAAAATHRLVPVVTRLAMARRVPDWRGHYLPGASHRATVHGTLDIILPT